MFLLCVHGSSSFHSQSKEMHVSLTGDGCEVDKVSELTTDHTLAMHPYKSALSGQ